MSFVTDGQGQVVQHTRYRPYGVDAELVGTEGDRVSFAGRREVGDLMVLGERIYDPAVGRFLSPDPLFNWVNVYSYTLGNPIDFWDPDGAQSTTITGSALGDAHVSLGVATAQFMVAFYLASSLPAPVGIPIVTVATAAYLWRVLEIEAEMNEARKSGEPGGSPLVAPGGGPVFGGGGFGGGSGGGGLGGGGSGGTFCGMGGPEIMLVILLLLGSARFRRRFGNIHRLGGDHV